MAQSKTEPGPHSPVSEQEFYDSIQQNQIKYVVVPGKHCGPEFVPWQNRLFDFWHKVWSDTFKQISIDFSPHSEEFCRHEEITSLVQGPNVIGVAATDVFDLSNPIHLKHHYFANYPDQVIHRLQNITGDRPVMTFGYLGVADSYRHKFGVSDLLLGLSFIRLLHSRAEIMITYTRNTRRTHDLTYRIGAKSIAKNLEVRGEPSDFVYFDRKDVETLMNHRLFAQMVHLWQNKIFEPSFNLEKEKTNNNLIQTGDLNAKSDNRTSPPNDAFSN